MSNKTYLFHLIGQFSIREVADCCVGFVVWLKDSSK